MSASYDVRPGRTKRSLETTAPIPSESASQQHARHASHHAGHFAERDELAEVQLAIGRTRQWLLDRQNDDGSWCAELEGDTILESETILMLAFLGREHTTIVRRAAAYLVGKQLPGGGW